MQTAVSLAAAAIWCLGAAIVLRSLIAPAARQLAAELRALLRLLRR